MTEIVAQRKLFIMKITVDLSELKSEEELQEEFYRVFGFPGYYGMNWNAWIDCMSCIDDSNAGMSKVTIKKGDSLSLEFLGWIAFAKKFPETAKLLCQCIEDVNERFAADKSDIKLILIQK